MPRAMRKKAEESLSSCSGFPIWKLTRSSGGTEAAEVVSLISETRAARTGFRRKKVRGSGWEGIGCWGTESGAKTELLTPGLFGFQGLLEKFLEQVEKLRAVHGVLRGQ